MSTRKLFRMKYEPCTGRCYATGDVLDLSQHGMQVKEMAELLARLVRIHEPACGNEHLAYGLDLDEANGLFIGSFQHYGQLDLVADPDAFKALSKLADMAIAYYDGEDYARLSAAQPGLGHNVCEHGEDPDLIDFCLQHSGLSEVQQREVRAAI